MANRKQNKHEREALMYLRLGNVIGGQPVEVLAREAADALDPTITDGIRGLGVAIPKMAQALKILAEAYASANAALAVMQEQESSRARARKRKKTTHA